MTDFAAIVRTEDGSAAVEAAIGPSQYGHAAIAEIVDAWESRGATPRARRIRRECARAALQITGENFAEIGRRIQCTRAAISAGVREFCAWQKIPNRVGRAEAARQASRAARTRVLRGEVSEQRTDKRDALTAALEVLRGVSRKWIAQQCGVSHNTVWRWFMGIRRPLALVETLNRISHRAQAHPIQRGRRIEKNTCQKFLATRAMSKKL